MILQAILSQAESKGLRQYISGRYHYHDVSCTNSRNKQQQEEDCLWNSSHELTEYIDIFLPEDLNFEHVNKINAIKFETQQKMKTKAEINISKSKSTQQRYHMEESNHLKYQQIAQIIKSANTIKLIFKDLEKANPIQFQVLIKGFIDKGKVFYQSKIDLCIYEQDKQIENQIKKLLPSNIKLNTLIIKFIEVPASSQNCYNCTKQLTQYPIYWCRWSPKSPRFLCLNCVQKDQSNYQQSQNTILLMRPTKKIAMTSMGNNLQPSSMSKNQLKPHKFVCNGCQRDGYEIGQPRYVCLGCSIKPQECPDLYDLCEDCIKEEIQESAQSQQLHGQGHQKGTHPFLRIQYNVNDYFDY